MITHHRSSTNKEGHDIGESRSAELMTFHGIHRCQPFLSHQELAKANLSPLQHFVLGGFKNINSDKFIEYLKEQKQTLNSQIRSQLEQNKIKSLDSITIAAFDHNETIIINQTLFNKQLQTYEKLPEVLDKIPRLLENGSELKEVVLKMVPMLMNFDQNAELKPDCSENKAFPARTQIRERTNAAFRAPLVHDLEKIEFSLNPSHLLSMDTLIATVRDLHNFYTSLTPSLKSLQPDTTLSNLFASRGELAKEYISQFPLRATFPETHQTLLLFTYYMIDDLDVVTRTLDENYITNHNDQINAIKAEKFRILQHFVTHRMLNDSITNQ
jgi:hypothetical protein